MCKLEFFKIFLYFRSYLEKYIKYFLYFISCIIGSCIIGLNFISISIFASDIPNETNIDLIRVAFPVQHEFNNIDINKNLTGYNYEYLMKISQYTGWEYEFIIINEKDSEESLIKAKNMVARGEADILGGITYSEELNEIFAFGSIPAGINKSTLAVLDNNNSIDINNYYNNPDFTVALNKNDTQNNQDFFKFIEMNNITANIIYTESEQEAINSLYRGEADAVLSKEISSKNFLIDIETFGSEPFYFISNKNNIDFLQELDNTMSNILLDDPYTNNYLKQRFFTSNHTNNMYFSKEDREYLDSLDVINVGFSSGTEPFYKINLDNTTETSTQVSSTSYNYTKNNAKTEDISGITIDILNKIAKILNIEFNYIYCSTNTELYEKLSLGEVDIIGVIPSNYELAYYLDVILSSPYISSTAVRVNKSYTPLEHFSINEIHSHYITNINDDYTRVENLPDAMKDLNNGSIKYLYANPYMVEYLIQNNAYFDIDSYQVNGVLSDISFGISKATGAELLQFINHAILHISETELDEIILNNSYNLTEFSLLDIINDNPVIIIFSITTILLLILFMAIIMHKNKKSALYKIINIDHLTGLMTRYKFIEETKNLLENAQPEQYMLISVDIDNFQYINESYGYEYGSNVLVQLANQLKSYFGEHCVIAREKDDTFLILLDNTNCLYNNYNNKETYLENISKALKNVLSVKTKINTSQGVYYIKDTSETISYIIDCANSARILGKKSYNSSIAEFTEEMRLDRENKNNIVTRMEDALATYEFKVFYQAKISLITQEIVGAEALVRWIPKDGTMIFPDQFIPLFENNGFILNLDYYIFEQVCIFIKKHQDLIKIPKISVNLSGVTLSEEGLINILVSIAQKYNLSHSSIELEITESAIMKNVEDVIKKIDKLKELGFTISMDDFGSGISSLNNLKDISVDVLKIDKAFMNDSLYGEKGIPIIKNVINLSKDLKLKTVAEGVETKEHVELLTDLGCDIAQGYYFSRPINQEDFLEFIKNFKFDLK